MKRLSYIQIKYLRWQKQTTRITLDDKYEISTLTGKQNITLQETFKIHVDI